MTMCRELFHQEPKLKKKYSEWLEPEPGLEDKEKFIEFEEEYHKETKKELMEKWERQQKTLEETGGTAEEIQTKKEKHEKTLRELEADYKIWVEYRKKPGYAFRGKEPDERKEYTTEQLIKSIEKKVEDISKNTLKHADKENLKTISLTTSKINYLDPRLVAQACL
jgi:DNA topoisomerase-1